jgi:hypothetical protein
MDMQASDGFFLFMMFAIVVFAGLAISWHYSRSQSLLEQWAAQHGYQLLRGEYRTFRRGPFFWTTSKGQTVYYVEVLDPSGNRRRGWVRCGGWFLGLLSDRVDVRWEE